MSKELVSIIVPVYNSINTLEYCIDSICMQTYQNIEIIIVDDGSIDGSGELSEALANRDRRCLVFHKENGGVSSARNLGIKHAHGKYIMFCDSDDYYSHEYVETMVNNYEDDVLLVVGYNTWRDERLRNVHSVKQLCEYSLRDVSKLVANKHDIWICTTVLNKIYEKDRIKTLFDVRMTTGEDFAFNVGYIQGIKKVRVLPYVGYNHQKYYPQNEFKYKASLIDCCLYCKNIRRIVGANLIDYHANVVDKSICMCFAHDICKICCVDDPRECMDRLETYRFALRAQNVQLSSLARNNLPYYIALRFCEHRMFGLLIVSCRFVFTLRRLIVK